MFTKNVAAISVALALMFGASAPEQTNPLRIIADTDTLVPGGAGQTFQTFFQLDGVDPDISGRNVVFFGSANVPFEHNVAGIYCFDATQLMDRIDG